jgi:ATP-dependent Clp protease ATP-binding subunit ClpA
VRKINLDILVSEANYDSEVKITFPLALQGVARINSKPNDLAKQVYNNIHKRWLKQGVYEPLLKWTVQQDIIQDKIQVRLDPSKELLFPELFLEYDFFYFENDKKQFIGFIPALRIESAGITLEELQENISNNVQLEFIRSKRLHDVPSILTTQWLTDTKLHKVPVEFTFYTLLEVEQMQDLDKQSLLPEIATKMQVSEKELFGLQGELDQLFTIMKAGHRNSTLVIAGSGKGKTTLIREFCRRKIEAKLEHVSIWEVSAAQLLHRLTGFGSWEQYLGELCTELRKKGDILYINSFIELFEVGQYIGNSMSMADYLRDYIARGEICLLTECSPEEASQIELRSPGYLGLFSSIKIEDLPIHQIQKIVIEKVNKIAESKNSAIEEDAMIETLRLQQWYTPYSGLPGKTIHFLDALISDKEKHDIKLIDKQDIYAKFCQETGMPEFMINPEIPLEFEKMDAFFKSNIFGQDDAIETVLDLLVSIKAAVIRRGKPLASLLFVGPTGVGKTELAKVLAQFMFGNRNKMIRFDMSEFSDLSGIMRLTGDSLSGSGLLTSAVRQEPFSVILFDELEKVHPAFYDLLLQILGEGRLTDARGRVADFCSTIIIMTSNIGARAFQMGSVGFVETKNEKAEATAHFKSAVQAYFRPELFNRLDRIIGFAPLEKSTIRNVMDREIDLLKKREGIKGRNIDIQISKEVLDHLGEEGYNAMYGARFLQRAVQEKLVIPLSETLNKYEFNLPLEIKITYQDKEIKIKSKKRNDIDFSEKTISDESDLKIIDFVKQVTQKRRDAGVIEKGTYFAKFLSKIDRLQRNLDRLRKKKKENEFWKMESERKQYYDLKGLENRFTQAFAEVQEIESENFLLLNGIETHVLEQLQRFKLWANEFKTLKAELVRIENPAFMTCTLAVYGQQSSLFELSKMYLKIGYEKGFEIEPFTVWYDNDYEHNPENKEQKKYIRETFDKRIMRENYVLAGVEMEIKGYLPYLFLKNESGFHHWVDKHGRQIMYSVVVLPQPLEIFGTPEDVHRSTYFSGQKARRNYHLKGIKDDSYELGKDDMDYIKVLLEACDKQFHKNVDNYLL